MTDKSYWDANYRERQLIQPLEVNGYRNICNARIYRIKKRHANDFRSTLEIGGGGSTWLAYLATKYPEGQFAALDYSDDGARLLRDFIDANSAKNIKVYKDDFFKPSQHVGCYDFVYSHGVVEHFADLPATLRAHAEFLNRAGKMFTLIPNLAGMLGPLTRWMDRSVYDIHVVHDLDSFTSAHGEADLRVVEYGYLCSTNVGVLSSCVRTRRGISWFVYRALSAINKGIWLFEDKAFELPATRWFAPYIYAVSEKHQRPAQ